MNGLKLTKLLEVLLGKRTAYRLGRAIYLQARGDIANNMATNGELMVQHCVLNAWRKSLIPDNKLVVFDVGANIGDWSYDFVHSFMKFNDPQFLDMYLFEPAPDTAETLKMRLSSINHTLKFERTALSSKEGVDQLYINSNRHIAGTNSLYQQDIESFPVNIVKSTVSYFCKINQVQKIHLLKCDTEGHDMEVIHGALPMLKEGRITVFQFEYNHRWVYARNFLHDAFALTEGLPYKVAKLQSDHLLIFSKWHFELEKFFEGNYALIHTDALAWFPIKKATFDNYQTMSQLY